MSKEVDQKVVEMRFDNQQFERGVEKTMSTLDKLKKTLKFDNAEKSMNNLTKAANKVDVSGISKGIETVQAKFSAMEVIGATALANITNSAINAGKNITKALTITPVKSGLNEYETQINAIQTIMANTSKDGTTLEEVNAALDELNTYADMTIYNFTEMTKNIGTFTAAGLKLDESVKGIQGVANLAAISGSTSQQASTAMYQLSQALSAGVVQLMDWNSVVNAGMGGKVFQDAIIQTADEMNTVDKSIIQAYKDGASFRELLSANNNEKWFTSEILSNTLAKFTTSGVVDYLANFYNISTDSLKALQELGNKTEFAGDEFNAMVNSISNGNAAMAENITSTLKMASTAEDAATKVKTFTQLKDTIMESVQSGWTQTWELIIGDFEEAKNLWSGAFNAIDKIIQASANARNAVVEGVLSSKWNKFADMMEKAGVSSEAFEKALTENLRKAGIPIDKMIEKYGSLQKALQHVKDAKKYIIDTLKKYIDVGSSAQRTTSDLTNKLQDFQTTVNQVIHGDFGNGVARIEAMNAAGKDYATTQALVNKVWERSGKTWSDTTITAEDLAAVMGDLSDEEASAMGITKEQTDLLKQLSDEAAKTGVPVEELIESFYRPSGRELIIEAISRSFNSVKKTIGSIKNAWNDIFHPDGEDAARNQKVEFIYGLINGINELTKKLEINDEKAKKLRRTFAGLFAVIDLVATVTGGAFRIAFKVLTSVLSAFNLDILDVTAFIGDALVALRNFIKENSLFNKAISLIVENLPKLIKKIQELYTEFKNSKVIQQAIAIFEKGVTSFKDIGTHIISGLVNGLKNGSSTVLEFLITLGSNIIDSICKVLGIHSPSKVFYDIGKFILQGLVNGLKTFSSAVGDIFEVLGDDIKGAINWVGDIVSTVFKNVDFSSVLAAGIAFGTLYTALKGISTVDHAIGVLENLTAPLEGFEQVLDSFSKTLKAFSLNLKAQAIKAIAQAIAILVGSVIAMAIAMDKSDKIWEAIGVIGALSGILIAMIAITSLLAKFVASASTLEMGKLGLTIASIAVALIAMSRVVKALGSLSPEQYAQGIDGIASLFIMLLGMFVAIAAVGAILKTFDVETTLNDVSKTMIKLSVTLLLMVAVIALINLLDITAIAKGALFIVGFLAFMIALGVIIKDSRLDFSGIDQLGKAMIKMAIALGLMVIVVKLMGLLNPSDIVNGIAFMLVFSIFLASISVVSAFAGDNVSKLGSAMVKMAIAIGVLALVVKMLGSMDPDQIDTGLLGVIKLASVVTAMAVIVSLLGRNAPKMAGTLMAMSIAIAIMAATAIILGFINPDNMDNGLVAIVILSVFLAIMVHATKNAEKCVGNIVALTVAISVMTACAILLGLVPVDKLAPAVVALSLMMLAFGGMVKLASNIQSSLGSLIMMIIAVGAFATMIALLSQLPTDQVIGSAVALSAVLLAVSGALFIASKATSNMSSAMKGVLALSLMIVPLASVIVALAAMQYISNAEQNAKVLVTMMASMTLLLVAVSLVGVLIAATGGTALSGLVAFAGLCATLYLIIGVLALFSMIDDAEKNVGLLILLMKSLTSMFVIISLLAPLAVLGVAALAAMTVLIAAMGAFMLAIGALVTYVPELQKFLENALPILNLIGQGIGAFFSGIISGFVNNLDLSGLIDIGNNLSLFMVSLTPFLIGAQMINQQMLDGVTNLTKMIMLICAADLVSTITGWITGHSSMTEFAEELKPFGEAIVEFSKVISGNIDENAVTAAANAGKILAEMAGSLPKEGGLVQDIIGTSDMGKFGTQLESFGNSMVSFSTIVSGNVNSEAIEAAANAGKIMAELNKDIPSSGGILQAFTGEKNMSTFGSSLEAFGNSIVAFCGTLGDGSQINQDAVEKAKAAGGIMVELQKTVPKSGGVIETFTGSKNLGTFGTQIEAFGDGMAEFADKIRGKLKMTDITAASIAGTMLAKLSNTIGKNSSVFDVFDDDLTDFADEIVPFGDGMAKFSEALGDNFKDTSVIAAANAGKMLGEMAQSLPDDGFANLKNSDKIVDFADAMKDFAGSVNTLDSKELSTQVINIKSIVLKLKTISESGITKFVDVFKKGGNKAVNTSVKMVSNSAENMKQKSNLFKEAANTLLKAFVDSIKIGTTTVPDLFDKPMTDMINNIKNYRNDMYESGKYIVDGFKNGIEDRSEDVLSPAKNMAESVKNAIDKFMDINSPSKVMYKTGSFVGEGFINAINDYSKKAYKASDNLGNSAKDGFSNAISHIQKLIDSGMDTTPRIRPVLDLSDITDGARMMNNMLNLAPSVGVTSNLNAISLNMARKATSNDDVISAINSLGRKMSSMGGNVYNIDGITYDDGTNVSNAIETLVKAVRIERRV